MIFHILVKHNRAVGSGIVAKRRNRFNKRVTATRQAVNIDKSVVFADKRRFRICVGCVNISARFFVVGEVKMGIASQLENCTRQSSCFRFCVSFKYVQRERSVCNRGVCYVDLLYNTCRHKFVDYGRPITAR